MKHVPVTFNNENQSVRGVSHPMAPPVYTQAVQHGAYNAAYEDKSELYEEEEKF